MDKNDIILNMLFCISVQPASAAQARVLRIGSEFFYLGWKNQGNNID